MISTSVTIYPAWPAAERTIQAHTQPDGALSVRIREEDGPRCMSTDVTFYGPPELVVAVLEELHAAALAALPSTDLADVALAELADA